MPDLNALFSTSDLSEAVIAALFALVGVFLALLTYLLRKVPYFSRFHWGFSCLEALPPPLWLFAIGALFGLLLGGVQHFGYLHMYKSLSLQHLGALSILCIIWFLLRWKRGVVRFFVERVESGECHRTPTQIAAVSKLTTILIVMTGLFMFLGSLNVRPVSLFAFGGIGGAAIALAGRDVITNLLSGLMILTTRPFAVGDRVLRSETNCEGFVEHIGWYLTRFRGLDKVPFYVPNGRLSTEIIVNVSRRTQREIRATLRLCYRDIDQLPEIVSDLEHYLRDHPIVDSSQPIRVFFNAFDTYSLNLFVRCLCTVLDLNEWSQGQQEIFLEMARIIRSHHASFAFPTRSIALSHEMKVTT